MLTRLERTIRQRLPRGVDYRASLLSGLWQCRADPKTVSGLVLGLVAEAGADGGRLTVAMIPFPETREYVQRVLDAQQAYRATYPRQLGLQ